MLMQCSLNHAQECAIIKIAFLHPLCLSNSVAAGEVGHAVPYVLLMSSPAYFIIFIFILSSLSAILSGRVLNVLGMPDLSTFYLALSGP